MPIKPETRNHCPATWPPTRARILARAGNRCEQCHVANGDDIVRGNTFRYCGIEGLGGTGGPQNTLVEKNLIEWIG